MENIVGQEVRLWAGVEESLKAELGRLKESLEQKRLQVAALQEKLWAAEKELEGIKEALACAREMAVEKEKEAWERLSREAASAELASSIAYLKYLDKEIERYQGELAKLKQMSAAEVPVYEPPLPGEPPQPLVTAGSPSPRAWTTYYTLRLVAFLNARHYLVSGQKKGSLHAHTWQFQVEIDVPTAKEHFLAFRELQEMINELLLPYEGTVLNEQEPFCRIPPITENLGAYFYGKLFERLKESGLELRRLSVWESPTRGVEISGRLPGFIQPVGDPLVRDATSSPEASPGTVTATGTETFPAAVSEPSPGPGRMRAPFWLFLVALFWLGLLVLWSYRHVLFPPPTAGFPWGSDTWGHLFKAEFLLAEMKQGRYLPAFFPWWYEGCAPFRYWAPLPYYLLALLEQISGNLFTAGHLYIFLCLLGGGVSWLAWRHRLGLLPAVLCGLLWGVWPDNVRVAFSEGNLPRVLATAFLPLLVALYLHVLEEGNRWSFSGVVLLIHFAILCHAMVAAVYIFSLASLAVLLFLTGGCSIRGVMRGLAALSCGAALAAWWLLPALKGGLAGLGKEVAAGGVQFISAAVSLNPLARFNNREAFYWGVSIPLSLLFLFIGWRFSQPWVRAMGILGCLLFILTFPTFAPLHHLLPFAHLLWPLRFTAVASLALLVAASALLTRLCRQGTLNRLLTVLLFILALGDGYASLYLLAQTRSEPYLVKLAAFELAKTPGWRVATLDLSQLGSPPSYYFTTLAGREQVFGWAWQGATTAPNLVLLNTALEYGHYHYLFRSLLYLGATDLVVKEDLVKDKATFRRLAQEAGYREGSSFGGLVLWHRGTAPYLLLPETRGLAVGRYAGTLALLFPQLEVGRSRFIDDYSPAELARYPLLILSGAAWHSREKAEEVIISYARSGGHVVVDFTGFPRDVLARQPLFLGVWGEEVTLYNAMSVRKSGRLQELYPFAEEYRIWKCLVPHGLDEVLATLEYFGREVALYGTKEIGGAKVLFLGGNLAFHAYLTGDPLARSFLEEATGLRGAPLVTPQAIPLKSYALKPDGYFIGYHLPENSSTVIPVAAMEGMEVQLDGEPVPWRTFENLLLLDLPAGFHELELTYHKPPIFKWGYLVSGAALLAWLLGVFMPQLRRPVAGLLILLALFFCSPAAAEGRIIIDGRFEDWAGQAHMEDALGDGGFGGDVAAFYWATNEGESRLFFMVERYPPQEEGWMSEGEIPTAPPPPGGGIPANYYLFVDTNDNGNFSEPVDRLVQVSYQPKMNFGDVNVRVYRASGGLLATYGGKWGEGIRQGQRRCEFYVTMDHMGIDPGQCIRMYLSSQAAPPDRCPDSGDIQWAPVPALETWMLAALFTAGLFLLGLAAKKREGRS